MSITGFARANFFDKSVVSRYLNGERVPTDGKFLECVLQALEAKGEGVAPQERDRLITLHEAAMRTATPQEYRVRIAHEKLQVALDSQQKAEAEAAELKARLDICLRQFEKLTDENARIKAAWDADRAALWADKGALSNEITVLRGQLHDARARASAAAAWVAVARGGLELAAVFLDGDVRSLDRLLNSYSDTELARLVERFVVAGIVAVEVLSMDGKRMPYGQALRSITPHEDVVLFPGLSVGPWPEVLALAAAFREGGDAAARRVRLTMDVPGAINVSFRFVVSALLTLTGVPDFPSDVPGKTARLLIEALDAGYAA